MNNKNACKDGGIYSKYLTEAEKIEFDAAKIGEVEDEIRLMRIRLARALAAEKNANGLPEIEEVTTNEGGGVAVPRSSEKKKMRDYVGIIDKTAARIESLERTRKLLLEAAPANPNGDMMRDDITIAPDEPIPVNPIL